MEKVILLSRLPLKYRLKFSGITEFLKYLPPKDPAAANLRFSEKIKAVMFLGRMIKNKKAVKDRYINDISLAVCNSVNGKGNKPYDYSVEFKNEEFPVLIMTGLDAFEPVFTNSGEADLMEKEFKHPKRVSFRNRGHFFFMEEKEECLASVKEFLEES